VFWPALTFSFFIILTANGTPFPFTVATLTSANWPSPRISWMEYWPTREDVSKMDVLEGWMVS